MSRKYFVLKKDDKEYFVTFPNCQEMSHKNMAEVVRRVRVDGDRHDDWCRSFGHSEIVSAGFMDADGNCYGHSESLGIKSRPEDTRLFADQS